MKRLWIPLFLGIFFLISCSSEAPQLQHSIGVEAFHAAVQKLTDVSVHDIFSPPVAARIYVYPNIAAYEVLRQSKAKRYQSLAGQLSGLEAVPLNQNALVNYEIAALYAFNTVARSLIYSEQRILDFQKEQEHDFLKQKIPKKIIKASKVYGEQVADHILKWAAKDKYHQTRTYPKYTIRHEKEFWKPTPPDYMDGIEPNWHFIRPMLIQNARQFPAPKPHPVSLKKNSPFYKQLMEVYEIGKSLNKEQIAIASFWDCNPYVSHHKGHAMFATKKMTPGGHWIGITGIASLKAKSSFLKTVEAYTRVSIALFDAFIVCWEEKWKSLVVRPETLINEFIDEEWLPALQTPPFPEYTSGHSVVSTASAKVLTQLFGHPFDFIDTTEIAYGLPARRYESFQQAAEEAAISRFYGGIHYKMAIEAGIHQGAGVGDYVVQNLLTDTDQRIAESH